MKTFQHRNTAIEFDETRGDFYAVVGGKGVRKASLAAMKKQINADEENAFQPFTALECCGYNGPTLDEVLVTGIEKARKRRFGGVRWQINGRSTAKAVCENSIANINRIKLYRKKKAELEKIIEQREAEIQKIEDSITRLTPP